MWTAPRLPPAKKPWQCRQGWGWITKRLNATAYGKLFLEGSAAPECRDLSAEEKYQWTETGLVKFKYNRQEIAEVQIRDYLDTMT